MAQQVITLPTTTARANERLDVSGTALRILRAPGGLDLSVKLDAGTALPMERGDELRADFVFLTLSHSAVAGEALVLLVLTGGDAFETGAGDGVGSVVPLIGSPTVPGDDTRAIWTPPAGLRIRLTSAVLQASREVVMALGYEEGGGGDPAYWAALRLGTVPVTLTFPGGVTVPGSWPVQMFNFDSDPVALYGMLTGVLEPVP